MRYTYYILTGDVVDLFETDDPNNYLDARRLWATQMNSDKKIDVYLFDKHFNFWQQVFVTGRDKLLNMVVQDVNIPDLVRMRQLIG